MADDVISLDELQKEEEPKKGFTTPEIEGEESVSGTTPHPESDDDVLKNAKQMGLQRGENPQHPKQIDVSRDVDTAEEYNKTH